MNEKNVEKVEETNADNENDFIANDEVRQEFEDAEDRGESELDQLKSEVNEPHYILPSPIISVEDATFENINPDQQGEAFGLAYQANEPLDFVEQLEERDEERWELNPASADDFDETSKEIEGGK
jgi:Family of unknown function (DUF6335)